MTARSHSRDRRVEVRKRARDVQSGAVRKAHVHQDDIRFERSCARDGAGHRPRLSHDFKPIGFIEQGPQAKPQDFMIIHHE